MHEDFEAKLACLNHISTSSSDHQISNLRLKLEIFEEQENLLLSLKRARKREIKLQQKNHTPLPKVPGTCTENLIQQSHLTRIPVHTHTTAIKPKPRLCSSALVLFVSPSSTGFFAFLRLFSSFIRIFYFEYTLFLYFNSGFS